MFGNVFSLVDWFSTTKISVWLSTQKQRQEIKNTCTFWNQLKTLCWLRHSPPTPEWLLAAKPSVDRGALRRRRGGATFGCASSSGCASYSWQHSLPRALTGSWERVLGPNLHMQVWGRGVCGFGPSAPFTVRLQLGLNQKPSWVCFSGRGPTHWATAAHLPPWDSVGCCWLPWRRDLYLFSSINPVRC